MNAYSNRHPIVSAVHFIFVMLITMFVVNPVIQLISLLGAILLLPFLKGGEKKIKNVLFYVLLFLIIALTNPLFSHNGVTELFFLGGNRVTLEAVVYGVFIAVMLLGALLWCKCYSRIITSDKLIYLFSRLWVKLSLVLSTALRFIPLMIMETKKVRSAQKALGVNFGAGRIRTALGVFYAMTAWSLENAVDTALSMKARGYGSAKMTNFSLFKFTKKDLILIIICVLTFGTSMAFSAIGEIGYSYYPHLKAPDMSAYAIVTYSSFLMLSLTPFLTEVKEGIVWKYSVSKI